MGPPASRDILNFKWELRRRRRLSEIDYSFSIIPLFPLFPFSRASRSYLVSFNVIIIHCERSAAHLFARARSAHTPAPAPLMRPRPRTPAQRALPRPTRQAFSGRTSTFFFSGRKLIGFSPRVEHIFYWPLTAVIYCVSKGGERHLAGVLSYKRGFFNSYYILIHVLFFGPPWT